MRAANRCTHHRRETSQGCSCAGRLRGPDDTDLPFRTRRRGCTLKEVVYTEIEAKSALNRVKGMPFDWSLNPYVGCPHACRYCFSRAYNARYRDRDVGEAFDRSVEVRTNFADQLRAELRRRPEGSVAIGT